MLPDTGSVFSVSVTSAGDDLRGLRWNGNWSLVDPSNEPAFVVFGEDSACASVCAGAFLWEVRAGGAWVGLEAESM